MKIVALIPARYGSTRFPAKMLAVLKGKTIIRRTYEATVATGLFDDVRVVTDDERIYNEVVSNCGKAMMSKKEHETGSDRIAEAAAQMNADIIINVQGDEPFTQRQSLKDLINVFKNDTAGSIDLASLAQELYDEEQVKNPNCVKVVLDKDGYAMYFSRSPIPYHRNNEIKGVYYQHIGIYAFRRKTLLEFARTPMGIAENMEKIEAIRYLENGRKMKMVLTDTVGIRIDTPEDFKNAERYLEEIGE
ncbi:MAG: 3-deoxy-manno-octulosonate cytidylyltransferase [Prevotellaceae bacterium]|nr:3-deoxy-manno-octulosonate cytidylyltransferase [Prevotellaceae bacterium]